MVDENCLKDDERYMQQALDLAYEGLYTTDPNPRVGAVLVKHGMIIGQGYHQFAGAPHAEINALQDAKEKGHSPDGATAYVTLEPCSHFGKTPPCAEALVTAGVSRVVIGMKDPNPAVNGRGCEILKAAGIRVDGPVLEQSAIALNPGFNSRMTRGTPWVRCKLAMSLDGRTAMASGESKWITGPEARRDVQRLRAMSSAIVTGIGTVKADNPSLNVRGEELGVEPSRQPQRIVVDSHFAIDPRAKVLHTLSDGTIPESVSVFTSVDLNNHREKMDALEQRGVKVVSFFDKCSADEAAVPLKSMLLQLGQSGVNEVLVESGARLAGAFLEHGLIDELILYVAPSIMGDSGKGLFHLPTLQEMSDKIELDILEVVPIGTDLRVKAKIRN